MTLKKESFFNYFLISLIIVISRFLNFFDFKIKSIFIFSNILLSSFILMIYVKPILDESFESKNNNTLNYSAVTETIPLKELNTNPPETIPVKSILYEVNTTVAAKSFLIFDIKNDKEIYSLNKNETYPPASLVKMLSVMYFYPKIDLNTSYDTYQECNLVEGQKIGYRKGEKVTGKDLIYSSLIFSAGDSICNLFRITDSSIVEFNAFAREIGLKNSNFTNFIGLDYPGNITTSEDLLVISKLFIKNELFNEIVSLKSYKMVNGKVIYNTNKMLFENVYSVGIKTGTTYGAKENLVYRYVNKDEDKDILIIILNSGSRYQDIRNIIKSLKSN